jgi:hypothetical protein
MIRPFEGGALPAVGGETPAQASPIQAKDGTDSSRMEATETAQAPAKAAPSTDTASRNHALRVTAILGSDRLTAVVEGAGPQPLMVQEGERIGGARVAVIRKNEIVLEDREGLWTLPLYMDRSAAVQETSYVPPAQPAEVKLETKSPDAEFPPAEHPAEHENAEDKPANPRREERTLDVYS